MSCTEDKLLNMELTKLECHFTWDMKKEDTNITDHLTRLEQNRDLNLGEKDGIARTHNSLAYVRYLLGSYEEALTNLQKSVELTKDCYGDNCDERLIVTYGNFAWLHFHMKHEAECKSYLDKLKEIIENNPPVSTFDVHHVVGEKAWALFKFSRKYYNRAIECFKKALELEPEEGEWNAGYAIVLYRTEKKCTSPQDSSAIQQLRRAIETNPDNDELKLLLALKLATFKLFVEAEDLVERALEKSPDSPHVIRYVGKYLREYGKAVDRSIGLLKRALDVTPDSAFIHHQLALCYKKKKEQFRDKFESQRFRDLSISHFEKAVTLGSGFILAMAQLAALYGEDGQIGRADEMFQTALSTAKDKTSIQELYLYFGDFQQYSKCELLAVRYFKNCLKIAPDTKDGKKSAKNLRKIANKRLSKNRHDTRALGILEFIEQVTGRNQSTAEDSENVLESTCNEK